jgi:hypothetical protein
MSGRFNFIRVQKLNNIIENRHESKISFPGLLVFLLSRRHWAPLQPSLQVRWICYHSMYLYFSSFSKSCPWSKFKVSKPKKEIFCDNIPIKLEGCGIQRIIKTDPKICYIAQIQLEEKNRVNAQLNKQTFSISLKEENKQKMMKDKGQGTNN